MIFIMLALASFGLGLFGCSSTTPEQTRQNLKSQKLQAGEGGCGMCGKKMMTLELVDKNGEPYCPE